MFTFLCIGTICSVGVHSEQFSCRHSSHKLWVIHSTIMAHQCNICKASFSTKSNLTRHVTCVHDKKKKKKHRCPGGLLLDDKKERKESEENYHCHRCRKTFNRTDHLKRHFDAYHVPDDLRPRFYCPREGCEAAFTQSCNLNRHLKSVHEEEKPFSCRLCGKCFTRKEPLDLHLEKQHP